MPMGSAAAAPLTMVPVALAACVAGNAPSGPPGGPPPTAVLEAPGDVPCVAACLLAAYADDPFRIRVQEGRGGIRLVAYGAPTGRGALRPRPRFSVEVGEAAPGRVRVALRTVWTLLGSAAEVERLRARTTGCAGGGPPPARRDADPDPIGTRPHQQMR